MPTLAQIKRLRVRDGRGRFAATNTIPLNPRVRTGSPKRKSLRIDQDDRVYRANLRRVQPEALYAPQKPQGPATWVSNAKKPLGAARLTLAQLAAKQRQVPSATEVALTLKATAVTTAKRKRPKVVAPTTKTRAPESRATVPEGMIRIKGTKVDPFAGNPAIGKMDPEFKVSLTRGFEYRVKGPDGEVRLNNNPTTYRYKGKTIYGVPTSFRVLRDQSTETLVNRLVEHTSYAVDRKEPRAPQWAARAHGSIDKHYLYKGTYGSTQLHHIDQHYRPEVVKAMRDYEAGKLSKEQAQAAVAKGTRVVKTPSGRDGLEIVLAEKDQRAYVCLPGNAHDCRAPLYAALHPRVLHPETGKLVRPGIPKEGPGGRKEFTTQIRPGVWREHYKRESYALAKELSRRLKDGLTTPDALENLIADSRRRHQKAWSQVDIAGLPE